MRQAVDVVSHLAACGPDGALSMDDVLDRATVVRAAAETAEPMAPDHVDALLYAAAVALDLDAAQGV